MLTKIYNLSKTFRYLFKIDGFTFSDFALIGLDLC